MKVICILFLLFIIASCRSLGTIPVPVNLGTPSFPSSSSEKSFTLEDSDKKKSKESSLQSFDNDKIYDPFPDIDGYSHAESYKRLISGDDYLYKKELMSQVSLNRSNLDREKCDFDKKLKVYFEFIDSELAENSIRYIAVERFDNLVLVKNKKQKENKLFYTIELYNCDNLKKRKNITKRFIKSTDSIEFDLLAGTYVDRNGFLKKLGETGPSVGLTFQYYPRNRTNYFDNVDLGFHIHFSFDHFVDTDSTFLQPKFSEEDFTNYLWSIGPSFRYINNNIFQINYLAGLGVNFLEIDTNRRNKELSDEEATRTTISGVHQLSFFYRMINDLKYGSNFVSDKLIGINFLYYWMPDALGKFEDNTSYGSYSGGSYAIFLSLKIQSI